MYWVLGQGPPWERSHLAFLPNIRFCDFILESSLTG